MPGKRKPRQTEGVEFIEKLGADTTLGIATHSRESSAAWFPYIWRVIRPERRRPVYVSALKYLCKQNLVAAVFRV